MEISKEMKKEFCDLISRNFKDYYRGRLKKEITNILDNQPEPISHMYRELVEMFHKSSKDEIDEEMEREHAKCVTSYLRILCLMALQSGKDDYDTPHS